MRIIEYKKVKKKISNEEFQKSHWDEQWEKLKSKVNLDMSSSPLMPLLLKYAKKNQTILEAGCGLSGWVFTLNDLGYKIEGVDFAKETVKKINKEFPKLNVYEGDVRNLKKYKNSSIQMYLSFGVIEHFPEGPQDILNEANRVLKKGGILFLTIPYMNNIRKIKYLFGKRRNGEGQFYQYYYSYGELKKFLDDAGFKIIKKKPWDFLGAVKRDLGIKIKLNNTDVKITNTSNKKKISKKNISKKEKILKAIESKLCYLEAHSILVIAKKK